jgi:tripartite-type tricarboxylate transporter receptor subunit TctC
LKFKTLFLSALLCGGAIAGPLEFTVHHAPGGPSDTVTRIISKAVGENEFVISNRPGAGGRIAVNHLLSQKTVMLATMSQIYVANTIIFPDLEYNPERDLELIGSVASMPSVLVCNASKNINSVKDLLSSRSLNFGVAGYGSSEHLATEVLLRKASGDNVVVPYSKGGSAAVQDMVGGTLDCMFANYPTVKGWTNDNRLKFIMSSHPIDIKVPTWKETFKEEFPFQSYLGVVVASKMDPVIKAELVKKLSVAFAKKEFQLDLEKAGLFPAASTDKKSIESVLYNNAALRAYISRNSIKMKD